MIIIINTAVWVVLITTTCTSSLTSPLLAYVCAWLPDAPGTD